MKMFDNTYSYEDNQTIMFLVVDRQSKFVTYVSRDMNIAMDEIKELESEFPGREFTIVCYPVDVEEIIYLLRTISI